MVSATVQVQNTLGLHARPISKLVKAFSANPAKITITRGERTADAKSIYDMMALGAKCGEILRVSVDGENEAQTLQAVVELFDKRFNDEWNRYRSAGWKR